MNPPKTQENTIKYHFTAYFKRLNHGLQKLFVYYLFVLSIFTINRLVLMYRFMPENTLPQYKEDLFKVFWFGARFDTQVIGYTCLPIVLISLIFAFFSSDKKQLQANKYIKIYCLVIISLLVLILLSDAQYYTYFQSHYNVLIFGLVQDDTLAVMKSIWHDHPIIRILIVFFITFALIFYVIKKIVNLKNIFNKPPLFGQITTFLLFVGLLILGLRGSLAEFPLEKDNATVSDNIFLNFLTPNALFCLQEVVKEKAKSSVTIDAKELLQRYDYPNLQVPLNDYYGYNDTIKNSVINHTTEDYYTTTNKNEIVAQNPPDVVFALMESMSNYYLDFHNETNFNLMGDFSKPFKEDFVFRNFLSDDNGTIMAVENLICQIPIHPISQTGYKLVSMPTSVANVYKKAGYETIFITGGKLGWRNLDEFVPKQGFDKVAGEETIMKMVKNAQQCEWGVYDEYLFDYAKLLLNEKNRKPRMIFMLSTTNHTPFEIPKHYKPRPIIVTDSIKKLTRNNPLTLQNFTNYQYSTHCLGDFINSIKASENAQKTIIAATGDHNNWMLFEYDNTMLNKKYGVPLYMYVPKPYLQNKTIDIQRFGSHKDIFPTLFNLSLSNQKYFNVGYDLFSNDNNLNFFASNQHTTALDKTGAILDLKSKEGKALKWDKSKPNFLSNQPETLPKLHKIAKARAFLLHHYFNDFLLKK